jgi:hypothetical protein
LTLDGFDAVDRAFDGTGRPRLDDGCTDGVDVAPDTTGVGARKQLVEKLFENRRFFASRQTGTPLPIMPDTHENPDSPVVAAVRDELYPA